MGSGRNLLFLAHIVLNIVGLTISQPDFFYYTCFEGYGNYTNNSIYHTNRNSLTYSLSANTDIYGFDNSSLGDNQDRVNGIVLCRGDVDLNTCRQCINNAPFKLTQYCPLSKQAVGWYDLCMLRYSNETISGKLSTYPMFFMWNVNNVSSVDQFNQKLTALLDQLTSQAASGGSLRKFATGNETGPDFQTIYGLMQCTPDLSEMDCTDCLMGIRTRMWDYIGDSIGGRVVTPSCNLRFETYPFFNDSPADAPPASNDSPADAPPASNDSPADAPLGSNDSPADAPPGQNDNTTRTVIIVVSTVSSVITLVVYIFLFIRKRKQMKERRRKHDFEISEAGDGISSTVESLQYDFDTIKVATDYFSYANKLGQGGFGAVYKGKLYNGQAIAVKRLSKNSGQGELEFKNEATLVAKLQHRNLIRLLGFCLEGVERLLIYEFVTNSSLDRSIFDPVKRVFLDWERRYKIIAGIARGVLYLHEDSRLRIIHRDLKASNVLLDADMNPKISDFGMARLFVLDEIQGNTKRIVGTYGYMAPEYAMYGQFSVKSDVFSFGVLVLEIISGQKNHCIQNGENVDNLLSYAWKSWGEGLGSNFIDPTLRANSGFVGEMMRCIHIGLLCVQENVADRPTMASVVHMLNSSSLTLSIPTKPAFFQHSSTDPEGKSHSMSINEDSISELYPR